MRATPARKDVSGDAAHANTTLVMTTSRTTTATATTTVAVLVRVPVPVRVRRLVLFSWCLTLKYTIVADTLRTTINIL